MNSYDIFNIPIIVLCGGEGKRFRQVSELFPKIIAPLPNGETYLNWVLRTFTKGFHNIILATGYKHYQIHSYVRSLPLYHQRRISFSQEFLPMGTGGALLLAINMLRSPLVIVFNGDTINDIDLLQFIRDSLQTIPFYASISCFSDPTRLDAGFVTVTPDNRVISFHEKDLATQNCSMISRGLYLLNTNTIRCNFSNRCSIEYDMLPSLIKKYPVYAHLYSGSSYDYGTFDRYRELKSVSFY